MTKIITLPKKLVERGELVLVPRSDYERLLRIAKKQMEIEKGINKALEEARQGKVVGPFDRAEDLIKSLSK